MKKVNLLSKTEMKKVMGGNPPVGGGGGLCEGWYNSHDFGICFNCCVTIMGEGSPTVDPNFNNVYCDNLCNRF